MYTESSSVVYGSNSRLISPLIPTNGSDNHCVQFFYHMYGSNTESLSVSQLEVKSFIKCLRYSKFDQESFCDTKNIIFFNLH